MFLNLHWSQLRRGNHFQNKLPTYESISNSAYALKLEMFFIKRSTRVNKECTKADSCTTCTQVMQQLCVFYVWQAQLSKYHYYENLFEGNTHVQSYWRSLFCNMWYLKLYPPSINIIFNKVKKWMFEEWRNQTKFAL